jgi:hypothetical protein
MRKSLKIGSERGRRRTSRHPRPATTIRAAAGTRPSNAADLVTLRKWHRTAGVLLMNNCNRAHLLPEHLQRVFFHGCSTPRLSAFNTHLHFGSLSNDVRKGTL